MTPIIKIEHLSAGYDGKQVLSDVNLTVYQDDYLGIIGPNGGGKTTLMRLILGLMKPTEGTIRYFRKVKDENGEEQEITLGQLPVLVSVSYHYKTPDKTIIPAALQNVANTVAGKKVDSLPIIISTVIFVVMLITVVSIVYAMIRSSIISVGRNPMAQSAVYRDIVQLSLLVLAIIGAGVIAIYLILTRL